MLACALAAVALISSGPPQCFDEGWKPKASRTALKTEPFRPIALRPFSNGVEIELNKPLMRGMGEDVGDYQAEQWHAGSTDPGPLKRDRIRPKSVSVSRDRKRIFLELGGLAEGQSVGVRLNKGLSSASDEELAVTDIQTAARSIPARIYRVSPIVRPINALTDAERKAGFRLLFDGKSATNFGGWRKPAVPKGWQVVENELRYTPRIEGGDIRTAEMFGDFELRLEWKVQKGGNSGIMFRATEDHPAPYQTGPEMQVLDDELHPDGRSILTSAGSSYGLYARKRPTCRPAEEWNEVRILAMGSHVEYWLNGYKVVEYELHSADWKDRMAKSKFTTWPEHGKRTRGYIVFQDHGDRVSYRTIRIKKLD